MNHIKQQALHLIHTFRILYTVSLSLVSLLKFKINNSKEVDSTLPAEKEKKKLSPWLMDTSYKYINIQ